MNSCLSEIDFERILAGEAPQEIVQHVRSCAVCRQRVLTLARQEMSFRALLYRATCPTSEELAHWLMGWLPDDAATQIRTHLDTCVECQEEVESQAEILRLPLRTVPPADEAARRIVATLVEPSALNGYSVPKSTLALRGASATAGRRYQAEDIMITIDVEHRPAERYNIVGLMVTDVGEIGQFEGSQARLVRAGTIVAQTPVDDLDTFSFARIAEDVYTLEVDLDSEIVVIEQLDIR